MILTSWQSVNYSFAPNSPDILKTFSRRKRYWQFQSVLLYNHVQKHYHNFLDVLVFKNKPIEKHGIRFADIRILQRLDFWQLTEAVLQKCFVKEVFLKIPKNSQENIYIRDSFLIKLQVSFCNIIKKETLMQVFSCDFCEIFKNTFCLEYLWWLLLNQMYNYWLRIQVWKLKKEININATIKPSIYIALILCLGNLISKYFELFISKNWLNLNFVKLPLCRAKEGQKIYLILIFWQF